MIRALASGFAPVALVLAAAGCSAAPQASSAEASAQAAAAQPATGVNAPIGPLVPLTITTAAGRHAYRVEVARTPEQQEKGLMFRTAMPADQGMIFPMDPPRRASFWMKNTILPLDMIFIRPDGTIDRIAENTVPYSLGTVDSAGPVNAVLELNGGAAAAAGLAVGDKVRWPG